MAAADGRNLSFGQLDAGGERNKLDSPDPLSVEGKRNYRRPGRPGCHPPMILMYRGGLFFSS
jgi:hypothetical protein